MIKTEYLNNLKESRILLGYDDKYISLCIKYASRLIDNKVPVIFDTKHLAQLIGINQWDLCKMVFEQSYFYKKAYIPKKNGDKRQLDMPSFELKYIQRWILNNILKNIKISNHATGFCDNKSILNNAKMHTNKYCVVNMDISNFFPSISFEKVFRIFAYYGSTCQVHLFVHQVLYLCTHIRPSLLQCHPALR